MNITKCYNETFDFRVDFHVKTTKEKTLSVLKKELKLDFEIPEKSAANTFYDSNNPSHFIIAGSICDLGLLAHECAHVVLIVLRHRSIQDDETFCYLLEWLIKEGNKAINAKKKTRVHYKK